MTVWGAMSYRGVGFLKTLHGNLNQHGYIDILGEYMVPSAHLLGYGDHYWFQDDNAPCHRARTVVEWKQEHDIMSLQWPAQSPDLNPIEHLWHAMGRAVRRVHSPNIAALDRNLHNEWSNMPRKTCEDLVRSMPRRIRAVLDSHGGYTRY